MTCSVACLDAWMPFRLRVRASRGHFTRFATGALPAARCPFSFHWPWPPRSTTINPGLFWEGSFLSTRHPRNGPWPHLFSISIFSLNNGRAPRPSPCSPTNSSQARFPNRSARHSTSADPPDPGSFVADGGCFQGAAFESRFQTGELLAMAVYCHRVTQIPIGQQTQRREDGDEHGIRESPRQ